VHPSREQLSQYIDGTIDESAARQIREHLKLCPFCRELVEDQRLLSDFIRKAADETIPAKALKLAERLYRQALAGKVIPLQPLLPRDAERPLPLAAHGEHGPTPRLVNLTTLCSENPEIVLRVMRDLDQGQDYLQLISDDPVFSAHVLVQVPELEREFMTDENGRVTLEGGAFDRPEELTWQIKMPDAVFSLQPLVYDPDKTEYARDIVLETERRDKIKVTFEGKTEGKQITIHVLELDGSTDFGPVKVNILQGAASVMKRVSRHESFSFELMNSKDEIKIRLFQ
jgi:hypothetical protein